MGRKTSGIKAPLGAKYPNIFRGVQHETLGHCKCSSSFFKACVLGELESSAATENNPPTLFSRKRICS
jgi:hypothetical protein